MEARAKAKTATKEKVATEAKAEKVEKGTGAERATTAAKATQQANEQAKQSPANAGSAERQGTEQSIADPQQHLQQPRTL